LSSIKKNYKTITQHYEPLKLTRNYTQKWQITRVFSDTILRRQNLHCLLWCSLYFSVQLFYAHGTPTNPCSIYGTADFQICGERWHVQASHHAIAATESGSVFFILFRQKCV